MDEAEPASLVDVKESDVVTVERQVQPPCACGHRKSMHEDGIGCIADRCMNVCWEFRPIRLAEPGERPVFGVHRVMPGQAWTPEPLSDYWKQGERWEP